MYAKTKKEQTTKSSHPAENQKLNLQTLYIFFQNLNNRNLHVEQN